MRTALLTLLVLLTILGHQTSAALAGPDRVTGGVTVPDGRLTGGGADGGDPRPPNPEAADDESPGAHVAQEGAPPPEAPEPQPAPDREDVDVQVPVRDQPEPAPTPVSPPAGATAAGLAQTGFPLLVVAALGGIAFAAGTALRAVARR